MKKAPYGLLICLALFACPLFSQAPVSGEDLSLSQALEIGLENNFQIKIARNAIEIAKAENTWGNAGALPNVNAALNVNNGYTQLNQPASFLQVLSTGSTGVIPAVDLFWTLYDGGRVKITKQQLETLEGLSMGQAKLAVENTVQNVILAYFQVQLRREQIRVLEEVLKLSRERIELEETRREFGQASTFDILQTRDAYLNDSTNYILQLTGYQNALHNLNQAMGVRELNRTYTLTDSLMFSDPNFELETLRSRMLANNVQLSNLQINRELAQLNTRSLETERMPNLQLNTGATYNFNQNLWGTGTFANGDVRDLGGIRNRSLNGFINLSATYNIFNGGVRELNVQTARIRELNAQLSIEETQLNLMTLLENTYATFVNQQQALEVTTSLVENARRNLEIAGERYQGGLINAFDYRVIQINYINAAQARFQVVFNLKQTETDLRRLVGELVR